MSSALSQGKNLFFTQINRVENVQSRAREIANSIEFNPNLESVYVDRELNVDDERAVRSIRDAVFRNKHVKKLNFYGVKVDPKTVGRGLCQMKNLAKILFDESEIAEADQPAFAQMLQIQGRKLQGIELYVVEIGDICAQAIGRSLRFRSSLKNLEIISCGLSETGFIALGEALQYYSSLTRLVFLQSGIVLDTGAAVWAKTIERNTSLEILRIHVDQVPPARAMQLLDALTTNKTLRKVDLEGLELGREGSLSVALLIEKNDTIETIVLTGTFDHEAENNDAFYAVGLNLAPIAQALVGNSTLKRISFHRWAIRTDEVPNVCDAHQRNKTLEELKFGGCQFDAEGMVPLFRILPQLLTLKRLYMWNCKIDDDGTDALCDCLQQNKCLECLDLFGNQIGNRGASALSKFLSGNETLKQLDLYNNNIADAGFASFAKALESNSVLKYLHLKMNDSVGERGLRALLDGVRVQPVLIHVSLPDKASDLQNDELQFYLCRNEHLRPLLSMSMPAGLWPRALKRADDYRRDEEGFDSTAPDMLYFLVKEKYHELFHNISRCRKRKRRHD